MAYQTVNPYDNQIVATFDDLTDEQVMGLLGQAQKTFESWSQTSFGERAAVCRRAAEILTERRDEFARLLTLEMGKLFGESLGEVALTAESLPTTPRMPRLFSRRSTSPRRAQTMTPSWSAPRSE
jgi:succinate-semialdehyde dehydrogenase/glutarate-semialdehyde dehydrogenase